MIEFQTQIDRWLENNKKFVLARVIKTWGSGPRPAGSMMLISEAGEMYGSVSGGCVENEVIKAAYEVLDSEKSKLLKFGIANEDAWTVGLTCGGKIEVFVEPFWTTETWEKLKENTKDQNPVALITRLDETSENKVITSTEDIDFLAADVKRCFESGNHQVIEKEIASWFIHLFPGKNKLLIIGAAHVTTELVRLASYYDFETIVIDPRQVFTEKTQFPVPPDQLLLNYPSEVLKDIELDAHVYVAILSHDPKIDDDALKILLRSEVAYIGAMGSRNTHAKRVERLSQMGFTGEEIARIHAPIGINIKTKSANEIALAIMAEVVGVKNGGNTGS